MDWDSFELDFFDSGQLFIGPVLDWAGQIRTVFDFNSFELALKSASFVLGQFLDGPVFDSNYFFA